jgi:hypothetical protein
MSQDSSTAAPAKRRSRASSFAKKSVASKIGLFASCTENVAAYTPLLNPQGKRCLTIGASGDQAIDLLLHGAEEVVMFDQVDTARRLIELKMAALAAHEGDPDDFMGEWIYGIDARKLESLGKAISPRTQEFFEYVDKVFDGNVGDLFWYWVDGECGYMSSEVAFTAAATAVRQAREAGRVSFVGSDIRGLPYLPGIGSFDVINISNVLEWLLKSAVRPRLLIGDELGQKHLELDEGTFVSFVGSVIWPIAGLLRPGGAMMASYVYAVPGKDDEEEPGMRWELKDEAARRRAFAPPRGFTVEEHRWETVSRESGGDDVAVIIRREA